MRSVASGVTLTDPTTSGRDVPCDVTYRCDVMTRSCPTRFDPVLPQTAGATQEHVRGHHPVSRPPVNHADVTDILAVMAMRTINRTVSQSSDRFRSLPIGPEHFRRAQPELADRHSISAAGRDVSGVARASAAKQRDVTP
ncbi:hypothetical protein Bbelb_308170 [Branchiostoma belcheri]|nr:hypothetical protein Bbelb_308170 [Branchiostoma belcheri]